MEVKVLGNGEFNIPTRIATNNTHLVVADEQNHRVQVFDINGNYVSQFGSQGSGNGQFGGPSGIAILFTHIFVADANAHRMQIFDIDGNYMAQFGSSGTANGEFQVPRELPQTYA